MVEAVPTVMVVDDSITVRKVTERLLKRHNMRCVTAKDGVDALAVLASPVLSAGDLSMYRSFRIGTDLPTIAGQARMDPTQAKVIHRRPALIQQLEWRPQPLGPSTQSEAVSEVVFNFYNGELYRLVVNYDRYRTEGLTAEDLIDAFSATYGTATRAA